MGLDDITRIVIEDCEKKGLTVSNDIVSFLIHSYRFDPECGIPEDGATSNNKIIGIVTEKLLKEDSPSLLTLKMQLYFGKHYGSRAALIKKHRQKLERRTQLLVREICNVAKLINDGDAEKLYQKIIVVTALVSGLGNPMEAPVLRETSVALQSVYGQTELNHFVTLSKVEKKSKLGQLIKIVAGIRLFNRDCQRGGAGIDDLPQILNKAMEKSHQSIFEYLQDIMRRVYRLTAAIETIIVALTSWSLSEIDDANCSIWAIEMLTACRQQEIFIRKLLADVENCGKEIKLAVARLKFRLLKIHDTVRYRTAIPTIQVYPQFIDLADIWMSLQNEVIILSHINNLAGQIKILSVKNFTSKEDLQQSKINRFIKGTEILTDAERLERSMGQLITECGECHIYYANSTKNFERIHLEFLGFCAWSFIAGCGALIPGNPNIGVVMWRGKYFAFSSSEVARKFGEDPNRFIYEAIDCIRRHPEYIQLFQVQEEIENMKDANEFLDKDRNSEKQQRDQCLQTELHVLPPTKSPEYHHSIWQYKKKALKLVNISDCLTKSTQTSICYFKR